MEPSALKFPQEMGAFDLEKGFSLCLLSLSQKLNDPSIHLSIYLSLLPDPAVAKVP